MPGPSPASNQQANLPQSTIKSYDRKFIENLKANTPFVRCAERRELPLNGGNQLELFMYSPFGANTNQTAEGTVGSGIQATVLTTTATIGEFADYANFSSLALATALDPVVENVGKELSYRLGQSLSAIVRATVDGSTSVDSSVATALAAASTSSFTTLSLNAIRSQVQSMAGRAIHPFAPEAFAGIIHPFALGDCLADTSNNSPLDMLKHTAVGQQRLDELPSVDLEDVVELPSSGVHFFQTNLVTITSNYKAVTGLSAIRTYLFGKDGVFVVNLGARGDNAYGDGDWRNIKVNLMQNAAPSAFDPSGLIPGWTSYRVHFSTSLGPDTVIRLRYIDAASGIS